MGLLQNIANRKSTQETACFLWYNIIMRKQIPFTEYIIAPNIMQLRLNLNIEQYIQDDGKVQPGQNIVERMSIQEIFKKDKKKLQKKIIKKLEPKEGINERINRSIQAEGVFSKLKEGLGYKRFRHKGKKNIEKEIDMMAIAININTLLNKLKRKETKPTRYEKIAA